MNDSDKHIAKQINPVKMIFPMLIGLGVVGYMMYTEFDIVSFQAINFSYRSILFLITALGLMLLRDIGYIIRIKILSDARLNYLQATRIILLWEFTSAVTPSAIGGTSIAILFVHKEGIKIGRSSAMVMATSFLDELYFIIMLPLLLIFVNHTDLWQVAGVSSHVSTSIIWITIIGYSLKLAYLVFLSYGLFINPKGLRYILMQLFRLKVLRTWRKKVNLAGYDIISNSKELRGQGYLFWLKTFGATFLSWTSRYWIVNVILLAFWTTNYDFSSQFLIFARQLVMWIMMLVSPTPGGSGFAEYIFKEYLGEFLPSAGLAIAMAMLWRIITYYPYLIIGAFIVPKWIATSFKQKKKQEK